MLRFVVGLRIMSGSSVEEMVLVPVYDLLSSVHFIPPYFKTLRVPVQLPDYVQTQTA